MARNHRSYVTVAIGCTGGRHRSVYIAEWLATHFVGKARVLRDRVRRDREAGRLVIVTSHVLSELEELAQDIFDKIASDRADAKGLLGWYKGSFNEPTYDQIDPIDEADTEFQGAHDVRADDLKVFATVAGTVFLAELGDKTQLATMLFAADNRSSQWIVFAAASAALVASTPWIREVLTRHTPLCTER